MLKGFKQFILRGNVVDLAIAVIIGTIFAALVKAVVADLFTPLIAAIAGQPDFGGLKFTLHHSVFLYGDVINNAITFILVSAVVYFLVVMPLNKLAERRARGQEPEVEELAADVLLLTEIRDLLKAQSPGSTDSIIKTPQS